MAESASCCGSEAEPAAAPSRLADANAVQHVQLDAPSNGGQPDQAGSLARADGASLLEPPAEPPAEQPVDDAASGEPSQGVARGQVADPVTEEQSSAAADAELIDASGHVWLRRHQAVDPAVSRVKFDEQIAAYRRHESAYRRRGWLLVNADFPDVFLVLCAPHLRPAPVLFGVIVNFTNYDTEPLSVRVVDPWTKRPLRKGELLTLLPRRIVSASAAERVDANVVVSSPGGDAGRHSGEPQQGAVVSPKGSGVPANAEIAGAPSPTPLSPGQFAPGQAVHLAIHAAELLQAYEDGDFPFLCVPGVYEYHVNPAHTGDPWLLRRAEGVGTLDAILNLFQTYGSAPIGGYAVAASVHAQPIPGASGFDQRVLLGVTGLTPREVPA